MLTIYTDRFIPTRFAALAIGPVVLIRPRYAEDKGLLEHERVHVRQWMKCPIGFPLRYLLSRQAKLDAELEAYAEQARHYPDDRTRALAEKLSTLYGLDITTDQAEALLRDAINRRN